MSRPEKPRGKQKKNRSQRATDQQQIGNKTLARKHFPGFSTLYKAITNPVFRAIFVFMLLMSLFYGFIHSPESKGTIFHHHLRFIASVSGGILDLLGHDVTVDDTFIETPEIGFQIVRGCDGIEPTAAFISAVIASPISFWPKIPGILIGTISLLVINLGRIVSLYYVGVYYPAQLEFVHEILWQAGFVILAIIFWAVWVQWATRPHHDQSVETE